MVSNDSSPSIPPAAAPPPESRRGSRLERIFTVVILSLFGIAFGLGLFTFTYAKGFSYLSNDPAACVNCHIMREQYEGWSHSSHKAVATCNDCHTPHRFPDKWVIKGVNGFNHSVAFTTGNFPEPIMIRGFNANIAQENCVDCHTTTVTEMHLFVSDEELDCVACHGNVGHNNAATNIPASNIATPALLPLDLGDLMLPAAEQPDENITGENGPDTTQETGSENSASEGLEADE
jgi:cytochrome c nitrite reductase small subunit